MTEHHVWEEEDLELQFSVDPEIVGPHVVDVSFVTDDEAELVVGRGSIEVDADHRAATVAWARTPRPADIPGSGFGDLWVRVRPLAQLGGRVSFGLDARVYVHAGSLTVAAVDADGDAVSGARCRFVQRPEAGFGEGRPTWEYRGEVTTGEDGRATFALKYASTDIALEWLSPYRAEWLAADAAAALRTARLTYAPRARIVAPPTHASRLWVDRPERSGVAVVRVSGDGGPLLPGTRVHLYGERLRADGASVEPIDAVALVASGAEEAVFEIPIDLGSRALVRAETLAAPADTATATTAADDDDEPEAWSIEAWGRVHCAFVAPEGRAAALPLPIEVAFEEELALARVACDVDGSRIDHGVARPWIVAEDFDPGARSSASRPEVFLCDDVTAPPLSFTHDGTPRGGEGAPDASTIVVRTSIPLARARGGIALRVPKTGLLPAHGKLLARALLDLSYDDDHAVAHRVFAEPLPDAPGAPRDGDPREARAELRVTELGKLELTFRAGLPLSLVPLSSSVLVAVSDDGSDVHVGRALPHLEGAPASEVLPFSPADAKNVTVVTEIDPRARLALRRPGTWTVVALVGEHATRAVRVRIGDGVPAADAELVNVTRVWRNPHSAARPERVTGSPDLPASPGLAVTVDRVVPLLEGVPWLLRVAYKLDVPAESDPVLTFLLVGRGTGAVARVAVAPPGNEGWVTIDLAAVEGGPREPDTYVVFGFAGGAAGSIMSEPVLTAGVAKDALES